MQVYNHVFSSRCRHHYARIWRGHDGVLWSVAGINLPEYSHKPAVRRVMVLSAPGYTLAVLLFPCLVCIHDKNHWSCSVAVSLVFIERVAR